MPLELKDVVLFGIDKNDPIGLNRAADICCEEVTFADKVIITEHNYFTGRVGYSRFCIEQMSDFITTGTHALTIHADGYIQNPSAWSDSWLEYDYIGAVWDFHKVHKVGNGGFSLRSRRFMDLLSQIDISGLNVHPEDDFICRQMRRWLVSEYGIKFAPESVARRFSVEGWGIRNPVYRNEFGFHGNIVSGLPKPMLRKKFYIG